MAEFAMCVSYSKLGQKWSKSSKIDRFWKLRKKSVFSRIDHICGENYNIWHLNTFDPLSSLIRQNEILKFLGKSAFFNEESTNELASMLKCDKIHFFQFELQPRVFGLRKWSIREKTAFFSQFSKFLNFTWFWPLLTTFDPILSRKRT